MNTPKRGNNNHGFVAIEGDESMEVVSFRSKRRVGGRHGSPTPTTTTLDRHPYRIHFSITEKSARSWMRAPRRSIKWVFGLAHRQGESWKVEEQQVILTWNTKSGKIKSVNWNKHEILHLVRFRPNNIESNLLECSWRLRTGELLQLQVRPDVTSERERYTLNLDGESFASFPTIRELERDERQYYEAPEPSLPFEELLQDHVGPDKRPLAAGSLDGSATASDPLSDPPSLSSEQEICYRLSMAGFNHHQKNNTNNIAFTCGADDALLLHQDELHSDLYSPQLDALRRTITAALPSAEPIISRAIAHAFCAETGSMTSSCDSLSVYSLEGGCPSALEASVLKGALEWTRRTAAAPEDVDDERRLHFLQKLIDELLMHFRNENIDADETAKIVLNAAVVLGLALEHDIPKDTVLVCDRLHNNKNHSNFSEHDMIHRLQQLYGDIRTAAIAPFSGIGFARFVHSADAQRAAASSVEQQDDDLHLLLVAPATDFSARKFMFGSDTPKSAPRGVAAFHRRRHSSSTTLDSTDHTMTSAGSDDTP